MLSLQKAKPSYIYKNKETEFHFLISYSCIPTLIYQLEKAREKDKDTVLFCFSESIYGFLAILGKKHDWIHVYRVKADKIINHNFRQIWKLPELRLDIQNLYRQWFAQIPIGSTIYFFNSTYILLIPFFVWRLQNTCKIQYIECDPVELYTKKATTILDLFKHLALYYLYPVSFNMIETRSPNLVNSIPKLNDEFFIKGNIQKDKKSHGYTDIAHLSIAKELTKKNNAKVVWLTQPIIDLNFVQAIPYEKILEKCIQTVASVYPVNQHVVKFHPRTKIRERPLLCLDEIPSYIPAEFIEYPNLKVIITISSTAISSIRKEKNIIIISLVELIPFSNEAFQEHFRRAIEFFSSGLPFFAPHNFSEFRSILLNHL